MSRSPKADPRVTKRKVTMRSVSLDPQSGEQVEMVAVDYVPDDVRDGVNVLEAYLVKARESWQHVTVGDEPDAGPGGYDGQTVIPDGLDHPAAGRVYPATEV
jgi:hypothetical protein